MDGGIDLAAYLRRIGLSTPIVSPAAPSADLLRDLHWRHASTITFENLDVLLGRPISLDLAAISAKLVDAGRGGYCFEQNSLFQAALRALGFGVSAMAARVWWGRDAVSLPPCTHMTLLADAGGARFLCDVGFGGLTLPQPLRWVMGEAQATSHETYRLAPLDDPRVPGEIALEALIEGGEAGTKWERLYSFLPQAVNPADFNLANWFVSTHPESFFTRTLIAAMPVAGGRQVLQHRKTTFRTPGRGETSRELAGAEDLASLLQGTFGLSLGTAEIRRLWDATGSAHAALAK